MSKKLSTASLTARLNQAVTLLNSGVLEAAANAFRGILKDAPQDPNALHLLGRTLSHQGHPQDAIPLIKAALKILPHFAEAHFSLGTALQQCGQHEEAISHFRNCLALAPGQAAALAGLGSSFRQIGQPAEAISALEEAVRLLPGQANWHLILAEALVDQERMADAIPQYRQVIALGRRDAPVWNNLGMALKAEGAFDDAEKAYQQALEQQPNFPQALNNLGSLWRTRGQEDQAFRCFLRATTLAPNFADPHFNMAIVLVARQQMDEADAAFRRACTLAPQRLDWQEQFAKFLINRKQPQDAEPILANLAASRNTPKAWLDLALIQLVLGQTDAARHLIRQWLPKEDGELGAETIGNLLHYRELFSLSININEFISDLNLESKAAFLMKAYLHLENYRLTEKAEQLEQGLAAVRKALKLAPEDSHALCALALFYEKSNKHEQAFEAFKSSIEADERNFYAHSNYASMLHRLKKISLALKHFLIAKKINPESNENLNNLGICLVDSGKIDDGIDFIRKSVNEQDRTALFQSNLIFLMHFSSLYSKDKIFSAAKEYQDRYGNFPIAKSQQNIRSNTGSTLRIGFISNDFRNHVVNMFFEDVFRNLCTHDVECYLFSNTKNLDDASARLKNIAHGWFDICRMSDEEVTKEIQDSKIDILVDLSGHTAGNRLLIFARKPAPVQISWLGYFATTGLTAMDYIFGDPICTPPDLDPWFTERVHRLPDGFVCYTPLQDAPAITPLPALARGAVTFASANQLAKVTDPVIDLWCELLRRTPNSRLALRTMVLADDELAKQTAQRFTARGIDADRLDFTGGGKSIDILNFYANQADIALDPFPCVGGTTTCEALWMGVPVVTLLGDRFAGRHSASHLSNVGVPELIATTPEQYLEIAVGLANDLPRLADLRARLRPMMAASPLCDAPRFAANLMQAFRHCWQDAATRRQQA